MSYLMNGKPMWCRPARTRGGSEAPRDPDLDDAAAEHLGILAEAAQLVADGIRDGLIKPPTNIEELTGKTRIDRPSNVFVRCQVCRQPFQRGKKSALTVCFPCRLPAATCKGCGKQFQPQRRSQIVCGRVCAGLSLAKAAAERNKGRPTVECVVCGAQHRMRFLGGVMAVTCGRSCTQQHVARINREKKQQRQNNQ